MFIQDWIIITGIKTADRDLPLVPSMQLSATQSQESKYIAITSISFLMILPYKDNCITLIKDENTTVHKDSTSSRTPQRQGTFALHDIVFFKVDRTFNSMIRIHFSVGAQCLTQYEIRHEF